MKEKKIRSFQFKKVNRDSLEKGKGSILTEKSTQIKNEDLTNNVPIPKTQAYKPKTDHDLLRSIGDKENLSAEDKLDVIDYVFKKDSNPIIICHACGANAGTKYYTSHTQKNDIFYCSGCYQSLSPCDNCGMPAKQLGPKLKSVYCQFCKVTKVCDCCDLPISAKESNRILFVKGTYCHKCFKENERCIVCKTPIILEKNSFPTGGMLICLSCHSRKVFREEAHNLNISVIRLLNKLFKIKETGFCDVQLSNYLTINPPNQPERLGRFFSISGKNILTLYQGITRERAIGVFAYEYGKYVLKYLNPKLTEKNLLDGFAIWVKSLVLREYGEIDEVSEIKSKIYTNQIIKSLWNVERLGGIPRVIEKIRLGAIGRK